VEARKASSLWTLRRLLNHPDANPANTVIAGLRW
jgi:hypothetical protein